MKWHYNREGVSNLVCLDENEKSINVDCIVKAPDFIKYIQSISSNQLIHDLLSNKTYYIRIERAECYDLVCSGDVEYDCENIFLETVKTKLKNVLPNAVKEIFNFDSAQYLKGTVEYDEDRGIVEIRDYQFSNAFLKWKSKKIQD